MRFIYNIITCSSSRFKTSKQQRDKGHTSEDHLRCPHGRSHGLRNRTYNTFDNTTNAIKHVVFIDYSEHAPDIHANSSDTCFKYNSICYIKITPVILSKSTLKQCKLISMVHTILNKSVTLLLQSL